MPQGHATGLPENHRHEYYVLSKKNASKDYENSVSFSKLGKAGRTKLTTLAFI